jgi:hypothetical protein
LGQTPPPRRPLNFNSTRSPNSTHTRLLTGRLPFTGSYQAESRLRVMHAASKLLAALKGLLDATEGLPITILPGPFYDALHQATLAIAEAEGRAS